MAYLSIPLKVVKTGLARENNIKRSIDEAINMLLTTPRYNSIGDSKYGFVFNNMRFEIFDEHEGVIYNSGDTLYENGLRDLYSKKISGSSKNMNTFAAELKEAVKDYEKRLDDVAVTMTYIREERLVYITIKGVIAATKEGYLPWCPRSTSWQPSSACSTSSCGATRCTCFPSRRSRTPRSSGSTCVRRTSSTPS